MFYIQKIREGNIQNLSNTNKDITLSITDHNSIYCYLEDGTPFKLTDVVYYPSLAVMEQDVQVEGKLYIVKDEKDVYFYNGETNVSLLGDIKDNIKSNTEDVDKALTQIERIVEIINSNYDKYETRISGLEKREYDKEYRASIDMTVIQNGELDAPILTKSFLFNDNQTVALTKVEVNLLESIGDFNIKVNYFDGINTTNLLNKQMTGISNTFNVDSKAVTYVNKGYYTISLSGLTKAHSKFMNVSLVLNRKETYTGEIAEKIELV